MNVMRSNSERCLMFRKILVQGVDNPAKLTGRKGSSETPQEKVHRPNHI
jgi:hypothetical protein